MCSYRCLCFCLFFFKQKTAYEIYQCDWSSDVCSSDLNNRKTRLILNIPNRESIVPCIPDDVFIEVPLIVDADGVHPEKLEPEIPHRIVSMYLLPRWLRMEWALAAFRNNDLEIFKEFLIRDPRTKSYEQVESVVDQLMEELPEFRAHYKKN